MRFRPSSPLKSLTKFSQDSIEPMASLCPVPSSSSASARMRRVRQKGTAPELALRRELFRLGLRYRLNTRIPGIPRVRPDIVFSKAKVAVFVDGCFWHGCPEHGTSPKANASFWAVKIDANRKRDENTNTKVRSAGWRVIRMWEHEDPCVAAANIEQVVRTGLET